MVRADGVLYRPPPGRYVPSRRQRIKCGMIQIYYIMIFEFGELYLPLPGRLLPGGGRYHTPPAPESRTKRFVLSSLVCAHHNTGVYFLCSARRALLRRLRKRNLKKLAGRAATSFKVKRAVQRARSKGSVPWGLAKRPPRVPLCTKKGMTQSGPLQDL